MCQIWTKDPLFWDLTSEYAQNNFSKMLQVLYIRQELSKIQMFIILIDYSNAGCLKIQIFYCF